MKSVRKLLERRGDLMITVEESGSTSNLENWLLKVSKITPSTVLRTTGEEGVTAFRSATPRDTGLTASAWNYQINSVRNATELIFTNNSFGGNTFSVVQGIRYGHGTGTGGYVPPNDFVSPIMESLIEGRINAFIRSVMM